MQRTLFFSIAALIAVSARSAEPPAPVAFVDVNVVPMDRERVLSHQTVLVRDGVIAVLGPVNEVSVPADTRHVEGHGTAYLLPGLADMHTHLANTDDAALYLANGVTTVLQMGGDSTIFPIPYLRSGIDDGSVPAPQIFFGLMVDGPKPLSGGWPLHSTDEARAAVRMAKERGYDFIKVYNGVSAAEFGALVDEGRKLGLAVIGHGVRAVGLPAALFQGQVMVAHAEEFLYTAFGNKPNFAAIPEVVEKTYESKAYVTPNLSGYEAIARQWGKPEVLRQFLRDPNVRYLSPESRLIWLHRGYARGSGDLSANVSFLKRFTKALSDRGVPLLTGTDSPVIPGLVPGFSIDGALHALVDAGLTPFQALSAATRTPGEFIAKFVPGAAPFGVVAQGRRADLLLVAANPLQDLDTLGTPLGAMHAGRWLDSQQLRAMLEGLESKNQSELGRLTQ